MSKRSIDKQVYEQYVDATVALFMEHYAVALGDATMQTKAPELSCSETLDLRCMTAIRKECAKLRRKEAWKSTKRVLRSAAVLLIALLSLSSVLFMTVEAFRVPVINFFIEEGDGFWAITGKNREDPVEPIASAEFDPNNPLAGLLPEGYEMENIRGNDNVGKCYIYKTPNGNEANLYVLVNMADVTLDCENATISKQIKVAGCNGVYTMMENISQLAWVNQTSKTTYLLRTNAMDEETLILIAGEFMEKILK